MDPKKHPHSTSITNFNFADVAERITFPISIGDIQEYFEQFALRLEVILSIKLRVKVYNKRTV